MTAHIPRTGRPAKIPRSFTAPAPPPSSFRRGGPAAQISVAGSRESTLLAGAVAQALFGVKPRTTPRATPAAALESGDDMEPTVGSVLHFTPESRGWVATVTDDEGNEWQEPVVGWAVVVIWAAYSAENEDEATKSTKQFQTEVQPMTLTEDGTIEVPMFREGVTLGALAMPGMVQVRS